MKTLRLLGIIAITALIILGMAACGEPEPEYKFEGEIVISGHQFVGCELTARFWPKSGGSDDGKGNSAVLTWTWYKVGATDALTSSGNIFKPTEAGVYYVVAWSKEDDEQEIQSPNIEIEVISPKTFYGTWTTSEPCALEGAPGGAIYNETIVISATKIRLDSTWDGKDKDGNPGDYAQGHETSAEFEFFEYTFTAGNAWTELTGSDLIVNGVTYHKGYKVAIDTTKTKTKGYTIGLQNIWLYLLTPNASLLQIERSGTGTGVAGITTDGTFISRTYNKQ